MTDFPHGEGRGYARGCSCGPCLAAHAENQQRLNEIRAAMPPDRIPHGANGYVNYLCRCLVCIEGHRLRVRRYRQRRRNHWQAAS